MRYLILALAGGAALAAVGVTGLKLNSSASAAVGAGQPKNIERFLMQASGDEKNCVVEKTEGDGPVSRVLVAPDCDEMLPGLSGLSYWSENADGTVTLSADGTKPAVIFAEADGIAYESIQPRMPLISLISQEEPGD